METIERKANVDETPVYEHSDLGHGSHRVIVYNDDYHTFDDVASQISKATGCTYERGYRHADVIHNTGRDVVYHGSSRDCELVANVLRQIRLQVEVDVL